MPQSEYYFGGFVVNIEYLTSFILITGKKQEQILIKRRVKLKDLLENMVAKYGSKFAKIVINKKTNALNCIILINCKEANLDSYIDDEDDITFLLPIAGG